MTTPGLPCYLEGMLDASLLPISDGLRSLRVLAVQDAQRYLAGARDPLVQEFGHLPPVEHTEESVTNLAETEAPEGIARGDLGLLSIVDDADKFLGSLMLFNVTRDSAEVGVWLHPDERGSGHALGALELAIAFAKRSGLHDLTARTVADSYSANHVVERAGFQEIARGVAKTPAGEDAPHIHYRIELRG